jgi:CubicO group peptidase (beta-lactamase class C family)
VLRHAAGLCPILAKVEFAVERWLRPALDYVPRWLEYQVRVMEQPGCAFAVAQGGRVLLEGAFGAASIGSGAPLTPRHRFRVASHSKAFTAAAIMKLRAERRLTLDDGIGRHVGGLPPKIAEVTLGQLLSHSAGVVRDGYDSGQWFDRRPFLDEAELRADLERGLILDPGERFKYSNHGYGLVGLAISAVTGESYRTYVQREIVAAAGLGETQPDFPLPRGTPFARGHGAKALLGRRFIIPGENRTHALVPATGFVSTAADLARFFNLLHPAARRSMLPAAARREMIRRHWRMPHATLERHYGLGVDAGNLQDWSYFGHGGSFQGYITRTSTFIEPAITVSVLTNASDGFAPFWVDGIGHILRAFARHGAPSRRNADWGGRWAGISGVGDWLPMGARRVLVATPTMFNPLMDASELEVIGRDKARIALANGLASHGEIVTRQRNGSGRVTAVQFGGMTLRSEAAIRREIMARYER